MPACISSTLMNNDNFNNENWEVPAQSGNTVSESIRKWLNNESN